MQRGPPGGEDLGQNGKGEPGSASEASEGDWIPAVPSSRRKNGEDGSETGSDEEEDFPRPRKELFSYTTFLKLYTQAAGEKLKGALPPHAGTACPTHHPLDVVSAVFGVGECAWGRAHASSCCNEHTLVSHVHASWSHARPPSFTSSSCGSRCQC